MIDREQFTDKLSLFLDSEYKTALITGLDDDAKIKAVLSALDGRYTRGIMYVTTMGDISDILNDAFSTRKKRLSNTISRNKLYKIGSLTISFKKYLDTFSRYQSHEADFAIYFPVGNVLLDDKEFKQLTSHIQSNKAPKVLIVTYNDHLKDTSRFEYLMDQHIHHEIKHDNRKLYETVKANLKNRYDKRRINNIYKNMS